MNAEIVIQKAYKGLLGYIKRLRTHFVNNYFLSFVCVSIKLTGMIEPEIKTPHYNKVNPFVIIKGGATGFIDFVEKVFDAKENKQVRTPDRDGALIHAEVQIGDSMILLA